MQSFDRKLRNLRPPLRAIAPLTFWICVGFAWTNIAVWWLLSHVTQTAVKNNPVPIVGETFFTFTHWGIWFLFLGLAMIVALAINSWRSVRNVLIAGLASKLIWAYALIYMILHGYPVWATLIMWAFLAWVQAWTIIYFAPKAEIRNSQAVDLEREGDIGGARR